MREQDLDHQNRQGGIDVPDFTSRRSAASPRRTAPSRAAQQRMEELRYRSNRVEASFDEDEDTADTYIPRTTSSARSGASASMRNPERSAASRNETTARRTSTGNFQPTQEMNRHRGAASPRGRRRKARWKQRLLAALLVLVIIVGGIFGCSALKSLGQSKYWTIAVFGVDSRDGNLGAGALSDVIMLASINRRTGDVNLTSVYRDTYLQIDDDGNYHKINEAYFKGGPKQALAALNRNFDLDIDDYVTFNWKAVAEGLNVLGGVDLDISDKEFAYINAFITETVQGTGLGSVQLEHSGMNHLDGVQAVAYARLRLMDTDFNRTARQRKVLELAMQKAKAASKKTLVATAMTVLPDIETSIGADDIVDIAKTVKKYNIQNAVGFPFSRDTANVGKMNVVVPATLLSNVEQLHPFLYGDDAASYTPSEKVQEISAHIQKKTGVGELPNADIPKIGGGTGVTRAPEENGNTEGSGKADTKKEVVETVAPETEAPETESSSASSEETTMESTTEESTDSDKSEEEKSTIEALEPAHTGSSGKQESSEKADTSENKENTGNASSGKDSSSEKTPGNLGDSTDTASGKDNAGPEVGPVAPPQTTEAGPIAETAA